MKTHALCVTKTLEEKDGCRSGQEVSSFVFVEVDTLRCGNPCTSKYKHMLFFLHLDLAIEFCHRSEGPAQVFLIVPGWSLHFEGQSGKITKVSPFAMTTCVISTT